MKETSKIDEISSAELNGIKRHLIANLSPKQLAEFVLSFGDDMNGGTEYWCQLYKQVKKIFAELEQG